MFKPTVERLPGVESTGSVRSFRVPPQETRGDRLGTLFGALHDAVLFTRLPSRLILDVNPAFLEMFGYSREELLGQPTRLIHVDEEHFIRFGELTRAALADSPSAVIEFDLRRKDGSVFPAQVTVSATGPLQEGVALVGIVRDLTQEKQREALRARMEEQLRETTRDLKDFVETSTVGLHWVGPDGRILWANHADHAQLGYSREEYVGHDIREFHADPDVIEDILARLTRDERLHEFPARLRAKDGATRHVLIDSSVLWENGEFIHTRCFTRDVTAQRTLEAREHENARSLKTLIRIQEELARTLEIDRVAQAATDACTTVAGASWGAFFYRVTDAQGEGLLRCKVSGALPAGASLVPEQAAQFAETLAGERIVRSDDVAADASLSARLPLRSTKGSPPPVRSFLAACVASVDGPVHGGIFLGHAEVGRFTSDAGELVAAIAAQTATAIENSKLYHRVKESEERYRNLVTNAPDQIITVDGQGRIVALNRTMRGLPAEEGIGSSIYDSSSPDERERVRDIIEEVMRSQKPADRETRAIIDGQERWFHVRVAPLAEGGSAGAVLISTEITERKRAEAEIGLMRAQLAQGEKLSALGSLVSGVAHELRTPLTFLSNNAYLLGRRLDDARQKGEVSEDAHARAMGFVREIVAGVDRIDMLVEDLRRYTKTRQDAHLAVAPVDDMILDAIDLFRATNRHSHSLEVSLGRTLPVSANRGALQQLALNLLQNAADATPPGGRIRLVTRNERGRVLLEVADDGVGIPEDVQARMFEPLFTTKKTGTGLGLSIVKRIVDEHGAAISCVSAVGKGTTFRVAFPAVRSTPG